MFHMVSGAEQSKAQARSAVVRTCSSTVFVSVIFAFVIVVVVVVNGSFAFTGTFVPPPFALFEFFGGGDSSVQIPQQWTEVHHVSEEVQFEGQGTILLQ